MACIVTGCPHQPIKPTVVTACAPSVLVEPVRPVRPDIWLYYKIEDGKSYFIMEQADYVITRDYMLSLEGSIDFAIEEIRESNEKQLELLGNK